MKENRPSKSIRHMGLFAVIKPEQRLLRMRKSFDDERCILVEDYEYFTELATPRASTLRNKVARKSAGQSEQQSQERSERPSSGKTDD
jgi:hypothetical protein